MPTSSQALYCLRSDYIYDTDPDKTDWGFRCDPRYKLQDTFNPTAEDHETEASLWSQDMQEEHGHSFANTYLDLMESHNTPDPTLPFSMTHSEHAKEFLEQRTHTAQYQAGDQLKDFQKVEEPCIDSSETRINQPASTKKQNKDKMAPVASVYEIEPSSVVKKMLLPSFHSNASIRRANACGDRKKSVHFREDRPTVLGQYGADLVRQLNDVTSGECGVMTLNQDTGCYEWKLRDSRRVSPTRKARLRNTRSQPSTQTLPSGLWVSPHEKMALRKGDSDRVKLRSLPSIHDLSLRVGKGVLVNGALSVRGKHISLNNNQRSRDTLPSFTPPGWLPQMSEVSIRIPSTDLRGDETSSQCLQSNRSERTEEEMFCKSSYSDSVSCPPSPCTSEVLQTPVGDATFYREAGLTERLQEAKEILKTIGMRDKLKRHFCSGDTLPLDKQRNTIPPRNIPFGLDLLRRQDTTGESFQGVAEQTLKSKEGASKLNGRKFSTSVLRTQSDTGVTQSTDPPEQVATVKERSPISAWMTFDSNTVSVMKDSSSTQEYTEVKRAGSENPRGGIRTAVSHQGHHPPPGCNQDSVDFLHCAADDTESTIIDSCQLPGTSGEATTPNIDGRSENCETQISDSTVYPPLYEDKSQGDEEVETSSNGTGFIDSLVIPPPYPKLNRARKLSPYSMWAEPAQRATNAWNETPPSERWYDNRYLRRIHPNVMRMRVELPPSDPSMLCFQTKIPGCSHAEVLSSLENAFPDIKVASLRYDPIHLQDFRDPTTSGPRFKCMWLFKLCPESDATILLLRGFRLRGHRMDVRKADDVYAEEKRAFSLCWEMVRRGIISTKTLHHQREPLDYVATGSVNSNNKVYSAAERRPARKKIGGGNTRRTPQLASVKQTSLYTPKVR